MMSDNKGTGSVVRQILVALVIALLVGGSAPWWWKELFPDEPSIPQSPIDSPMELPASEVPAGIAIEDTAIQATESAEATAAPQDTQSYFDPFNDLSDNWYLGEWNRESWEGFTAIDNDTYLIKVTQVRDGFAQRISFSGHISADFDMRVDSLSESYAAADGSQPEIFCHGIYFRETSDSYYEFHVCDQTYQVWYFDGSSWNAIISSTESTEIRMWDWNTLRVIASGGNFDLYINDTYVTSFYDSRNPDGEAGLFFEDSAENTPGEIRFDNFILNNSN